MSWTSHHGRGKTMSPGIWHEAVTSLRSHRQYFKASKVAQFSCNKGVFWFVEIKINKQINKRIVVQMSCKAVNVSEYLLFSWNYWHWKNLQRFYPLGSDIQYFTFSLFAGIASNPCIEFRSKVPTLDSALLSSTAVQIPLQHCGAETIQKPLFWAYEVSLSNF